MGALQKTNLARAFAAAVAISQVAFAEPQTAQMSDDARRGLGKLIIFGTADRNNEAVTGSYRKRTGGVLGGAAKGSEIGTIPVEVAKVPIFIPIPILREVGMIAGGIKGGVQRQAQELRDRLTEDLVEAVDQPLNNAALANDVFWAARKTRGAEPKLLAPDAEVPADADTVLYISLAEIGINVQKKEAIISTTANATLERAQDGTTIYRTTITYSERDTLANWAKNDYALWSGYRDFAGFYIGRELTARLFDRIRLEHSLAPTGTATVKPVKGDVWHARTRNASPTLAWNYALQGADAGRFDPGQILWDIEIYDAERPVYTARQVPGMSHTLSTPLQACGMLRWSVRPSFPTADGRKVGVWMRSPHGVDAGNSNDGRAASVAHAYIQDFATLSVSCRRRK